MSMPGGFNAGQMPGHGQQASATSPGMPGSTQAQQERQNAILARLQQQAKENPQYIEQLKVKITDTRRILAQETDPQKRTTLRKQDISLTNMLANLQQALSDSSFTRQSSCPSSPALQTLTPASRSSMLAPPLSMDPPAVIGKRKLQDLVQSIDPYERLDPEVQDALLELSDEFIESVTTFAAQLAKHRGSAILEVKDLQLHLEKNYNIRVPGYFSTSQETVEMSGMRKRPHAIHAHQTRIAAVKKAVFDETNRRDKNKEE